MRVSLAFALLLVCSLAHAAIEMPPIFSDGMVLQRDRPIRVWGVADAGHRVRVEFAGHRAIATADAHGRWILTLPARAAGGPYRMTIADDKDLHVVRDILVGDVWLASGQSNMEWSLSQAANAQVEIARANDPNIRHFNVPHAWSERPEAEVGGGAWIAASPASAGRFSAVAHLFAREIRASTGVPIGIIESAWGGSRIEAWMDANALGLDAERIARDGQRMRREDDATLAETRRRLAQWPSLSIDDTGWSSERLDTAEWTTIAVPTTWEAAGWTGLDGVAWYRTHFDLTQAQAERGVRISLGPIDDSDRTWVNGIVVGAMRQRWNTARHYDVASTALHAGRNTVAVRVEDDGGGGGLHGAPDALCVTTFDMPCLSLAQTWAFRVANARLSVPDGKHRMPTLLHNRMIYPLRDVSLRGVIWYQGESNADTRDDALRYRERFLAMIGQWRRQWNAPELPFLWVQLANYDSGRDTPTDSPWALLRESQSAALALPFTAQATIIDIGTPGDIHPPNKQEVAQRLAHDALRVAYGDARNRPIPTFERVEFIDGEARLRFALRGQALAVRGGGDQVGGFVLAGEDRRFHPAQARIEGGLVVLRSPQVAVPCAVRYGWRDDPADANLIGDDGRPISPFRTDDW